MGKSKLIKELLTTANSLSYNNYDKRNFRCAVEALDVQGAAAGILSDEEKARFRSQKDAQPKPKITKVAAPSIDLDALVLEVGALVNRSVVAQTLDELTRNSRLAAWVQEGLVLHSGEHASDTCRFCLQPLQASRRAALEAHFNDAFAKSYTGKESNSTSAVFLTLLKQPPRLWLAACPWQSNSIWLRICRSK